MGSTLRALFLVAVAILVSSFVHAQDDPYAPIAGAPTDACEFDHAGLDTPLGVLTGKDDVPYQFACGHNRPAGVCAGIKLKPGPLVSLGPSKNGWTCVTDGSSTSGWVPADRVGPVPDEPKVAAKDWIGFWREGKPVKGIKGNRLLITAGKTPGTLQISGRAYWYGSRDDVHFGEIRTDHVVTIGPYLHAIEGDDLSGCVLDLKFNPSTHQFDASDNQNCGGMNVRFSGTWQRFAPSAAEKKSAAHAVQKQSSNGKKTAT